MSDGKRFYSFRKTYGVRYYITGSSLDRGDLLKLVQNDTSFMGKSMKSTLSIVTGWLGYM